MVSQAPAGNLGRRSGVDQIHTGGVNMTNSLQYELLLYFRRATGMGFFPINTSLAPALLHTPTWTQQTFSLHSKVELDQSQSLQEEMMIDYHTYIVYIYTIYIYTISCLCVCVCFSFLLGICCEGRNHVPIGLDVTPSPHSLGSPPAARLLPGGARL